jgi:DMSO reductase anchor subunit
LKTEEPHWPLVVMTVLTQLSVGAFATIWLLQLLGGLARLRVAALGSLLVGCMALGASTLHLGRPIYAYRALRMWKRSWLSREVLLFACFSGMSALYASSLWLKVPGSAVWGALTTLFGLAGVTASSCIYLVRARPAWNSKTTVAEFFLTAALLGPLFAASIGVGGRYLLAAPAVVASAALLNFSVKFLRMSASDTFELKASAWLLSTTLASWLLLRGALLIGGGIMLPLSPAGRSLVGVAFGVALGAEILGRYLFFVSVVPKNMADCYLAAGKAAA